VTRAKARELVNAIWRIEGEPASIVLDTRSKRPTYIVVSVGRQFRSIEDWRERRVFTSDLIVPVAI